MDGRKDPPPPESASPRRRRGLRILRALIGGAAALGVLLVLAIGLGWSALDSYPEEVSAWLSRGVGQRVSITSMETQWKGVSPRLTLHGVTLLDPRPGRHERALARFASLDVLLDARASVRSASFRPAAVTVHGASLVLIRQPDGSLDVQGTRDESDLATGSDALARLFFEHAQVSMRSSRLLWVDHAGWGEAVLIRDVDLRLRSRGERRHITLSGTVEEPGSGRFRIELDVEGNLLTSGWSGNALLSARDVDLGMAARIAGAAPGRKVEGRAELELSSTWSGGHMESARGRFRLLDTAFETAAGRMALPENGGVIEIAPGRGTLQVDSGALEWDWPEVFDERLAFSALLGRAEWRREGDATRVQIHDLSFENAHLSGSLEGGLGWSKGDPEPMLGLRLGLEDADLSHLPTYLPAGALPPNLRAWITRAVHGGRLEAGEVRIEGALRDWPFDEGRGSVGARARVSGVELHYARGWPAIRDLDAELRFEGRRAEFDLSAGRVEGAELTHGRLEIPRMGGKGATLHIEGELSGTTAQAAGFLRESPLAPRFQEVLDATAAEGPADLALEILVPLPEGPKRVSGRLAVRDNRVEVPGLDEGLRDVNGVFSFVGATIDAEGVEALYLGRPVTLRVAPSGPEGGVRIEAEGTTTREHLAAHLHNAGLLAAPGARRPAWLSRLAGETRWRSVVGLGTHPEEHEAVASIRVSSDLRGVRIDLPPPLAKAPPDSVDLDISLELGREDRRTLRARYGKVLSSVFALRGTGPEGPRLDRGAIRLGGDDAQVPDEEGLTLGGSLPRLSLGRWLDLLGTRATRGAGTAPGEATPSPLSRLRKLNLQVDELDAFGVPLGTTRIDAQADASSTWTASLVGANVLGEVRIPTGSEPVLVRMDRLILPEPEEEEEGVDLSSASSPDPAVLPAFRFTCAECKLGERALGTVDLIALPDPAGTRVESFYVRGEGYEARGSGAWRIEGGAHQSSLDAEVRSDDLGRLLGAVGHAGAESISGVTDMLISATWPGSPFGFDLRRLDGVLHIRASDGRLTQVRRGATGRLFGLLMLPSLPRRLALDFRDLFQEGLAFDLMEGSFSIETGDAYTNNFVIESPTATIELTGRTGLVDEDYDHMLTLTPKLSESIALLPIWLGERLLNTRTFDRVFAHRYSIRGPWSAPRIEAIQIETQPSNRP